MFKQAIVGISLFAASSLANAGLVVSNPLVTGADMAGIEVTVTFDGGLTDSAIWQIVNSTPVAVSSGNDSIDAEVLSGGAFGNGWEITQAGFTLGAIEAGVYYGDWVLTNVSSNDAIVGFSIDGWLGNGGIAFDVVPVIEAFPGSNVGQPFSSSLGGSATSTVSNQVNPSFTDLFWQLNVSLATGLDAAESLVFFTDTDALKVPTPATMSLLLGGLVLIARRTRVAVAKAA